MLRTILSLLLFASALFGQCLTHPTPGVVGIVGIPSQGCNEINGGAVPWVSLPAAPVDALGGPLSFVFGNVPNYFTAPNTYLALLSMDLIQPPPFQFPGTTLPNCQWVVGTAILTPFLTVQNLPGCQTVPWVVLPPNLGLQGFGFFCQGALWDLTQNKFAVSRPFAFQFQ